MLAAPATASRSDRAFGEAVRLAPNDRHAHEGLGWSLFKQRQFAEAELAFQEAVRLVPGYAKYHLGLGWALLEQKKLVAAEASLREAIRLDPAHPRARELLARGLTGQGKLEEAEALRKEPSPAASLPEPGRRRMPNDSPRGLDADSHAQTKAAGEALTVK